MTDDKNKPGLMRSIGAFVGEIVRAVKSEPGKYDRSSRTFADQDEVVLRRTTTTTTVDEVRVRRDQPK